MKKILFAAAVSVALILSGCSSSKQSGNLSEADAEIAALRAEAEAAKAAAQAAANKPIGAEGVPQYDWVYKTPTSSEGIYAVGSGKGTSKQTSMKIAEASANVRLAQTLETSVKAVVETYLQESGIEKNIQLQQHYMEVSVQKSERLISGATQEGYWMDTDGTIYMLKFMPFSFAAPETTKILKEETKNNAVLITEEDFAKAVEKYGLND